MRPRTRVPACHHHDKDDGEQSQSPAPGRVGQVRGDDDGEEGQGRVVGPRGTGHPVGRAHLLAVIHLSEEGEVGDEDGAPGSGDADPGEVHDDVEGVAGQIGVEDDAEQSQGGGHDDAPGGNLVLVESGRDPRSLAGHRHGAQCAPGGVQAGVERRERGGEDHDLDDVAGIGHADAGEEGDEGRLGLGVGRVRQDESQQHDRADVEDEDAQNHRVDRLGEDLLGVLRLTGGHTHHLRASESEDDAEGEGEDDRESLGEEAAIAHNVVSARGNGLPG